MEHEAFGIHTQKLNRGNQASPGPIGEYFMRTYHQVPKLKYSHQHGIRQVKELKIEAMCNTITMVDGTTASERWMRVVRRVYGP